MQGKHVFAQIDAGFFFEFIAQVIHQALVKIFAAEKRVAVGGEHFKLVLAIDFCNFNDRHVKGAAAQIVHRDFAIALLLVHTKGKRGRRRLIDNALDFKSGDATSVFGGLTL